MSLFVAMPIVRFSQDLTNFSYKYLIFLQISYLVPGPLLEWSLTRVWMPFQGLWPNCNYRNNNTLAMHKLNASALAVSVLL